jgi:uncharacterized membrane protein YkvA (DUF1232 family)
LIGWTVAASVVAGVLIVYGALLMALWRYARRHPDTFSPGEGLREALRLLPDVVRLVRRLAVDRTLPVGVRVLLVLLMLYLMSPIDLVPDFVPVLGFADDALVVAVVLRSVVRRAGPEALARHWPGSPQGLALVQRLAGIAS